MLPTLLTAAQVAEALNIARPSVYRLLANDPDFPRPIYVGPRSPRWREDHLDAWIGGASPSAGAP